MHSNSKKIAIMMATAASLLVAGGAQAIVGKSVSEEIVHFSDLNLDKVAGQKALKLRLEASAKKLCEMDQSMDTRSISRIIQSKRCYDETIAEAIKKVNLARR